MEIVTLLIPMFAVILTGFLFARFRLLPEGSGEILMRFAMWVAIPALLFSIIAEEKMSRLLVPDFYASFGGPILLLAIVVFAFVRVLQKMSASEAAMAAFMSVGSNTAFVALPVLHSAFGERAVLPTAIATVVLIVLIVVTSMILERSSADDDVSSIASQAGQTLLNPLVLSSILGIAYAATGFPLPEMGKQFLDLLATAVTPCALFAIGWSIRPEDIRTGVAPILAISTIKLVVFPALVLGSALLLELNPILTIAATICAAVPPGKTSFVLADNYQVHPERVASIITVSTIVSAFTLVVWITVLAHLFPGSFPK